MPTKAILGTSEIAKLTGVSRQTVNNWIKSGMLKSVLIGRTHIIMRQDYIKFIDNHRVRVESVESESGEVSDSACRHDFLYVGPYDINIDGIGGNYWECDVCGEINNER
ncbi:helix-turn-helix domain-containing protein [Methylophaga sp.]|jgi:excisionase family DNA binding protein|uniref:helix-turn-helix domain-containing protein n=1 Tax=Methylophaga sp. TaxID=2024840 RepID=UPI000C45B8C1|nr:helix-turn-helix domain-containing protein [Methylophaga sp.]MBP26235.1 hypothetical protein [Methylophaga sp.]|tara:strand:+ start:409 stop:735 length:327 start_codon:yes stop_codon:yes gene_type:complete